MPTQIFETRLPSSPDELFDWHTRPGALQRLSPPWESIVVETSAPVENGSRVQLRLKKGPFRFRCYAEHQDVVPGRGFTDVMSAMPFSRWIHRRDFEPAGTSTLLRDRIEYDLAGGRLGSLVAGRQLRRDISRAFAFRHDTLSRDLTRHSQFADRQRNRVAITGSGGLVGSSLLPFLTTGGHEVVRLVRRPSEQSDTALWQPTSGLASPEALGRLDALVHLAGENIAAGRWTKERKERIRASRIEGTRNLIRSLERMKEPPRTLLCASAIGYYGSRGEELLTEDSPAGEGFLARVCEDWEKAARAAERLGTRVVLLRFGVILTPGGGALAKMLPPFKLGAGGRLGNGRQYMSWVSIDDAVGAIHHALMDESIAGAVNVVAPQAATNHDFTRALARVLGRPTLFPVPAAAARLAFGEMADEMLLSSTRVRPEKLEKAGFTFNDVDLEPTLARLLGRIPVTDAE